MAKTVLVVGGRTGIGKAVISKLLEQGYNVMAASRGITNEDVPADVKVQKYDVTGEGQLELPDELHGLVYCPGTINLKPFNRFKLKEIQEELEINYLGAVKVLQRCIDKLKTQEGSSVVMFSTVAVQTGMPFHSTVSAAKGAVEGLVRSLAAEYAPKVRFNAIAPSLTETPLAEGLLNNDRKRQSNTDRHPLKKIGTPEDISEAVSYLISDRSAWVTGQILQVDGGMSAIRTL